MRAIRAKIYVWESRGGGICKTERGSELSVTPASLYPLPARGENLEGEDIYIIAFESEKIRPRTTVALWGSPKTELMEILKADLGKNIVWVREAFSDSTLSLETVNVTSDLFVEVGSVWETLRYGEGLHCWRILTRQIMTKEVNEEEKGIIRKKKVLENYLQWVKECLSRRQSYGSLVQELPSEHLKCELGSYWKVQVGDVWIPAEICRVTSIVYALAQYQEYEEEIPVMDHYGDEQWDTGRTMVTTSRREISPEKAFNMPLEVINRAVLISNAQAITKVVYAKWGSITSVICALSGEKIEAIWAKGMSCWRLPGGISKELNLLNEDVKFNEELYFPLVYMAEKQGLRLNALIDWL